mmetsp:Transcript_9997/g.21171  ORF Transcript_9997/g.21171 Transcript_9997/m.21171 type:complete len:225 (-) Transcript_9997:1707-2381(-)
MASSAERRVTAAMRARLSPMRRAPRRRRFAASSPPPRVDPREPAPSLPPGRSGEAFSTFFSVASVASLIFSRSSAEAMLELPASSTMVARSRRPIPATLMVAKSLCSVMASSALFATLQAASPRVRRFTAAMRRSATPCRVRPPRIFRARRFGRFWASLASSLPRIARCAQAATRSAACRAWAARLAASITVVLAACSATFCSTSSPGATLHEPPSRLCRSTEV